MSWLLLGAVVLVLAAALLLEGRVHRAHLAERLAERRDARRRGSHAGELQVPHVDLSRCLGCGTCIEACPEEGVLELIHGQAMVVHGARCIGHGRCAAECPTGAIAVTLADVEERRDLPHLDERLESPDAPGLFLAGEVTGYALVRTAIAQGTAVADEVARRARAGAPRADDAWDLCIVGAGPAGLACSLQARKHGLSFLTLEQEELGGTVAKYPRRKLVMTQPVELPLHGRLSATSYRKEELIELWSTVAREHELPIHTGVRFLGVATGPDGLHRVRHEQGEVVARHVCLALGRRGSPRKLGVPGEELPKVAYGLVDAQSYQGRRILVVGGGDSAVEAALGLAEQPGNEVALSYRRPAFFRLKARNEQRLAEAAREGRVALLLETEVTRIDEGAVELARADKAPPLVLANDDVFVLAGGVPPFQVLEASGVSFDPARRERRASPGERGSGLRRALLVALVLAAGTLAWVVFFRGYYGLPRAERVDTASHDLLRPSRGVGLAAGCAAALSIVLNLLYLLRRGRRRLFAWGSLRLWMSAHVVTGIAALLGATLHSAMAPQATVGGYSLAALAVLVATGAIGRYLYSFVPRAANGRELELDEARAALAGLSAEWDRGDSAFGARVRAAVEALGDDPTWRASLPRRLLALASAQRRLRHTLSALRAEGRAEGLSREQLDQLEAVARRAQRTGLMASHYEDLRGLLASWRWVHRWAALLLVLLVAAHVLVALRFGELWR